MAYFNGTNIAFNVVLNGSILDPEMVQFAETMKKYFTLSINDPDLEETYDLIVPDWVDLSNFKHLIPNTHERVFKFNKYDIDESENISSLFSDCKKLEEIYLPSCTKLGSNFFLACSALTDVTLGAIKDIYNTSFRRCYAIKNFKIAQGSKAPLLNLFQSPELTQESVKGIIDAYADMTSAGGAELHFADTVYNAIPEDVKQAARAKGLTFTQEK